jgi:hypothetical protein
MARIETLYKELPESKQFTVIETLCNIRLSDLYVKGIETGQQ